MIPDYNSVSMQEITQPTRRLDRMQSLPPVAMPARRRRSPLRGCCLFLLLPILVVALYLFAPLRTNVLLLGTDDSPERGQVGRTDTIILTTVVPLKPYVGMLSIPRDLWVNVPGVGEQRINTAYFFAEASERGSGPRAAMQTIRENFGIPVHYYAVIHMTGLTSVIDSLNGVDVNLTSPMGGYPAGTYHMNGLEALMFVRERSSSDDFSRMVRSQVLLSAVFRKVLSPANWQMLPGFVASLTQVIDTNVPVWQLPRLLFALARAFLFGIDSQTITREMVTPFVTSQGAQVLAPNWEMINPLLQQMFGK